MPYIPKARRIDIDWGSLPETPGELNYLFTRVIGVYMARRGVRYETINDILGALEGAKQEFVRRVVAPYEDEAIERNGDLY